VKAGKRLNVGHPKQSGGGVMSEHKDKVEESKPDRPKKPPGFRNFQKLLRLVVKAPPLKRHKHGH
jgi:hypothetical protein